MDNAIRTTLESWLPLIKGLSFDERVGFLTLCVPPRITPSLPGCRVEQKITDDKRLAILKVRDIVRAGLIELQNEGLTRIKATSASDFPTENRKTKTENLSHGTSDQIQRSLARAIGRKDAKDIKRLTKALEKAEEK